ETGSSLASVSRHLRRIGLARLKSLDPVEPVVRYEREAPGELLHIDTKRLGRIDGIGHRITGQRQHRNRGIGWDAVHLAIDDHSRVSFARI
ncbi:MAG: IS481 family transposase, partial [Gammaproteobacteria bacterium]